MEVSDSRKRLKNKTVESAQRSASRMCWQSHLCKEVTPTGHRPWPRSARRMAVPEAGEGRHGPSSRALHPNRRAGLSGESDYWGKMHQMRRRAQVCKEPRYLETGARRQSRERRRGGGPGGLPALLLLAARAAPAPAPPLLAWLAVLQNSHQNSPHRGS